MGGILLFLCGILSVLQCANSVRLVLQLHLEFVVFLSLKEKKGYLCFFFSKTQESCVSVLRRRIRVVSHYTKMVRERNNRDKS